MKKMGKAVLAVCFLVEILLFLGAAALMDFNIYFAVPAILAGAAACVTIYFLIENLRDSFILHENITKGFINEKIGEFVSFYSKIEKSVLELEKIQSQFSEKSLHTIEGLKEESSALINRFADESYKTSHQNQKLLMDYRKSCEESQKAYEENFSRIHRSYIESMEKMRGLCINHYEDLKNTVKEYTIDLQKKEEEYLLHVRNTLTAFQNENTVELEAAWENQLQDSAKTLTDSYRKLLEDTSDRFRDRMAETESVLDTKVNQMSECYNEIMASCSKEYLEKMTDGLEKIEEKYYKDMTAALGDYSNSLVAKSATAIAEVQKDNNLKLQELSSKLSKLAVSQTSFLENYIKINNDVKESVDMLIAYQKDETANGQERTLGYIDKVRDLLNQNNEQLYGMYQLLTSEQVGQYAKAMNDYREVFVKSNADALANVENGNIEMIRQMAENVSRVVESMQKLKENTVQNANNMMYLMQEFKKIVENGNKSQQESFQTFNGDFDSKIRKLSEKLHDSFIKYQDETILISSKIRDVTDEYHKLFDQIIKNQNEMNEMTKEDIELIKKMVET